jgi:hypothetical protein
MFLSLQEEMDRERLKEVEQEMIQRELEATEQQLKVLTLTKPHSDAI